MSIEVAKKLFTVDEYYRMAEAGILGSSDRVELIDGEILQMSPIGGRHARCVVRATHLFVESLTGRAFVSVQNSLRLNDYTEPQPDVVLLKPSLDDNSTAAISAADALLVVEVADTTLRYDRTVKLPRYAAAGVAEVWIENLESDELLVFRDPVGSACATSLTFRRGDSVSPIAFPDVVFKVDDLLGNIFQKNS